MSAFTPTNECTLKDQLVSYLRSHILSSPLKTVEFCTEASRILNISRSDALDLSQELDFEDGKLYNVAILFNISEAGKPMRPLYMDAICQAMTGHRDNVINSPCRERNSEKYAAVQGVVDAMVADLHKECSGGYALDSSVFIDVAIRHDLRRSEAWRLLEPMNFSEGLCVSAFSKWFDEDGNMRHLYWCTLADAHIESTIPGRVHVMATGEVEELSPHLCEPNWTRRGGLLGKSYKTVRGTTKNTTKNPTTPRKNIMKPISEAPTPSGYKRRDNNSLDSKHTSSNESADENDSDEADTSDDEERKSFSSRTHTPDWASSAKWKKKINYESLGGGM